MLREATPSGTNHDSRHLNHRAHKALILPLTSQLHGRHPASTALVCLCPHPTFISCTRSPAPGGSVLPSPPPPPAPAPLHLEGLHSSPPPAPGGSVPLTSPLPPVPASSTVCSVSSRPSKPFSFLYKCQKEALVPNSH